MVLVVYGLYIGSPFYEPATSALGAFFNAPTPRAIVAALYFGAGVISFFGLILNSLRWRGWGTNLMFLTLLFGALLRATVFGFSSLYWLFILALALVSAVANLHVKWEKVNAD